MYLVGKTGVGKSTLIANMCYSDLSSGEGLAPLDPHGDLIEQLVRSVLDGRKFNLIYFNATDPASALAFNPLEITRHGGRVWNIFCATLLLALLDLPASTLLDVHRLLDDSEFRSYVVGSVQNPAVRRFWLREYQKYSANFRAEAISPIQNKIGEFLVNPLRRRIVGQPRSSFDLRQVMDQGKILAGRKTEPKGTFVP